MHNQFSKAENFELLKLLCYYGGAQLPQKNICGRFSQSAFPLMKDALLLLYLVLRKALWFRITRKQFPGSEEPYKCFLGQNNQEIVHGSEHPDK